MKLYFLILSIVGIIFISGCTTQNQRTDSEHKNNTSDVVLTSSTFQEFGEVWEVYKEFSITRKNGSTITDILELRLVLEVKNEPGSIVSTALLPPGGTVKTNPFLSATSFDPLTEESLWELLEKAKSLEEFMLLLEENGYILRKGEQSTESQPDKVALRIAWEAVMETVRYESWNTEGVEYEATPHLTYAKNSPKYKPELWTVDFQLPNVEDQDMYVNVNIDTGKVLYLHEYAA